MKFLFFLLLMSGFRYADAQSSLLIPYRINSLWGFSDTSGNLIIQPAYADVSPFEGDDMAIVEKKQPNNIYFTLTDKSGLEVADSFKFIDRLSEGLRRAGLYKSDLEGFINSKGKWVLQPLFDQSLSFTDGFAEVRKDSVPGLIKRNGHFYPHTEWKNTGGLLGYQKYVYFVPINKNKTGIYSTAGKKLFEIPDTIQNFGVFRFAGLTAIIIYKPGNEYKREEAQSYIVNSAGKQVFEDMDVINEKYAWVKEKGVWEVINTRRKVIKTFGDTKFVSFWKEYAIIQTAKGFGVIDVAGKIYLQDKFSITFNVWAKDFFSVKQNKYDPGISVYDTSGNIVNSFDSCDKLQVFTASLFQKSKESSYTVIDNMSKVLLPECYFVSYTGKLLIAYERGQGNIIGNPKLYNTAGRQIFDEGNYFDQGYSFDNRIPGYIRVIANNKIGYLNINTLKKYWKDI